MTTRKSGLSESELFLRAQEPTEQAEQRRHDAKQFLKGLQARDDEVSARMAKLKAARLAAAAEAAPSAAEKPLKAKKAAGKGAKAQKDDAVKGSAGKASAGKSAATA